MVKVAHEAIAPVGRYRRYGGPASQAIVPGFGGDFRNLPTFRALLTFTADAGDDQVVKDGGACNA